MIRSIPLRALCLRAALGLLVSLASSGLALAELPPLPQPVTSFGATVADGWLYVYGGNAGEAHEFHRDCIRGDFLRVKLPDGQAWEKLRGDAPLLGSPMVTHEGWIYRVGGMEARNAKGEKNDLHSTAAAVRYHPAEAKWEALPNLPEGRSSHDITVVGNTLYAGGGWKLGDNPNAPTRGEWAETLLSLDLAAPEKGWQTRPQPFKRRALATVAHAGRLWFLGGMDHYDDPSLEVDWLDLATGQWGKGPELPESPMDGFGMAACQADGKLLVSQLSGKIFALSADAKSWQEVAALSNPRFFHRLLPMPDGRLVAVGGSNRKGQIGEPELISLTQKASEAAADSADAETRGEAAALETWPQWRGPNRDGISAEIGWCKQWPADGPPVLWRAQVGVGMSSAVLADGRLVTQGNDGKDTDSVIALDPATGKELWRFSFPCPATVHEMPIVPAGPGATPTIVGGHVYALSRAGDVLCLSAATGEVVWRKHLVNDLGGKRPVYGYAQSPLVEDGRVILDIGSATEGSGSTVALDSTSGQVLWKSGSGEAGYSSARVLEHDGRRLVAMFKGEALDVFDPADGRVLWSHRTTARDFTNAATPALVGHRVLVSNTGTDLATLLDWNTADELGVRAAWTHKQFALLFNSAILHEGCLFGFNEKRRGHHEFTSLDAETGETRWVQETIPTGTFILADGHWVFLSREGEVLLATAGREAPSVLARFQALEGKCYATPTLASGRLFVRSNTGEIAAFDLRPSATVSSTRR